MSAYVRAVECGEEISGVFNVASGNLNPNFEDVGKTYGLGRGAAAHLVAYVGHDGLMDFRLPPLPPRRADDARRDAVILACMSKRYFAGALRALSPAAFG